VNLGSAARKPKRKAALKVTTTKSAAPKDVLRSQLRETVTATILDAAEERFASQGLTAASLAEIAKAAGVAVGTLYNYFADREALVTALLASRRDALRAQLIVALEAGKADKFEQRLRAFSRAAFQTFENLRSYMKIMFQAEHLKHHSKTDIFQLVEQQIVAAGVAEGVIEKRDADTFATLYIGGVRSVVVRSLDNNTPFVDKADAMISMLLDGARRNP
jgi:AcrR family transcriptional regulator